MWNCEVFRLLRAFCILYVLDVLALGRSLLVGPRRLVRLSARLIEKSIQDLSICIYATHGIKLLSFTIFDEWNCRCVCEMSLALLVDDE